MDQHYPKLPGGIGTFLTKDLRFHIELKDPFIP